MRRWLPRSLGGVAILTAIAVLAGGAGGDDAKGGARPDRRFEAFGESNLETNGVVDGTAALFSDPSDHTLLVLSRQLRSAFALTVADSGVSRIPKASVRVEAEGVAAFVPVAAPAAHIGRFVFVDSAVAFSAEGLTLRIVPKPPAAGEISAPALLEYCPEYRYRRDRYTPSDLAVRDLSSYGQLTDVVVLLSISAPPSGIWVPRLMKIFQAAGNPVYNIRYLLIDSPEHPLLRRFGATVLPTVVLLQGDEELGRLDREPRTTLEEEIVAILKGEE